MILRKLCLEFIDTSNAASFLNWSVLYSGRQHDIFASILISTIFVYTIDSMAEITKLPVNWRNSLGCYYKNIYFNMKWMGTRLLIMFLSHSIISNRVVHHFTLQRGVVFFNTHSGIPAHWHFRYLYYLICNIYQKHRRRLAPDC